MKALTARSCVNHFRIRPRSCTSSNPTLRIRLTLWMLRCKSYPLLRIRCRGFHIRIILIILLKVLLLHSLLSLIEFLKILQALVIIYAFINYWSARAALLLLNYLLSLFELAPLCWGLGGQPRVQRFCCGLRRVRKLLFPIGGCRVVWLSLFMLRKWNFLMNNIKFSTHSIGKRGWLLFVIWKQRWELVKHRDLHFRWRSHALRRLKNRMRWDVPVPALIICDTSRYHFPTFLQRLLSE